MELFFNCMVIKLIRFSVVLPLCSVFGDVLGGNEIDHTVIKAHCRLFYVPVPVAVLVTILINLSR